MGRRGGGRGGRKNIIAKRAAGANSHMNSLGREKKSFFSAYICLCSDSPTFRNFIQNKVEGPLLHCNRNLFLLRMWRLPHQDAPKRFSPLSLPPPKTNRRREGPSSTRLGKSTVPCNRVSIVNLHPGMKKPTFATY